jgi:DcmR-like sensory protein
MGSSPTQPRPASWSSVTEHGHGVQFYSSDTTLASQLAGYVGTALVSGDASVVISTAAHRQGLAACLKSRGFDLEIATSQGRYIALDAADTLGKFCARGQLDSARFHELIGGTIERARAATGNAHGRVAAFGEMVALLWMAGHSDAALRLEELWNTLLQKDPFSLCCAYPMKLFDTKDAGPFLRVCAHHSHVFPTEQQRPPSTRFYTWPSKGDVAADSN